MRALQHFQNGHRFCWGVASPSPFKVFIPISGIFAVTGVVLHLRNGDRTYFHCFNKRYPESGINTIIPPKTGIRVHWSHWIAKSQIVEMVVEQQANMAKLRNGRRVPVSKNMVEDVRRLL